MEKAKRIAAVIATLLGVFLGSFALASAASLFITQQGGTGTSSPSGILYGDAGSTNHLNTVIIGSNLTFSGGTLSATGGGTGSGLGTSSPIQDSNVLVYSKNGAGTAYGVATSSLGVTGPITFSGTLGAQIGGSGGSFGCATCLTANQNITISGVVTGSGSTAITTSYPNANANTILGNNTGASAPPVFFATSSLGVALGDTTGTLPVNRGGTGSTTLASGYLIYGSGTNNVQAVSTSSETISTPLTGSAFNVVGPGGSIGCQTASGSQAGCLSSSDWTTFNNKQTNLFSSAGGITFPNVDQIVGFPTFQATSTTGTSTITNALQIGATTGSNLLKITAAATSTPSISTGGIVNITQPFDGTVLELVKNGGASDNGRELNIMQNGITDVQDMILASSSCSNCTAFNLKGDPTGKGIIKIEATGGAATGFSNASGISIDTSQNDTQGIFIKNGTGVPFQILNSSSATQFKIDNIGNSTTTGFIDVNSTTATSTFKYAVRSTCFTTDGTTCITGSGGGITSIGPAGSLQTGPAVTLGTSSVAFNGLTASTTITATGNLITFANTLAGDLGVGGGGTGLASVADGALLFGGAGGGTANLVALATSTGGVLSESFTTGRPTWISTSTLNLNANVITAGTLSSSFGGTGVNSIPSDQFLYGNHAGTQVLGVATSSLNLPNAALANSTIGFSSADSSLTVPATIALGASGSLVLNLTHSNTWTAVQQFNNGASTTNEFVSAKSGIGTSTPWARLSVNGQFNDTGPLFTVATTTLSSGSTTLFQITQSGIASSTQLVVSSLHSGFVQVDSSGSTTASALTSGQITTALGFTPFGGTNPLPVANGGTNDTSLTGDQILYTNHAGTQVLSVASSSLNLPNAALANSSITVNTTAPLAGGGTVSLGGTLTLTCSTCTGGGGAYPFTPTTVDGVVFSATSSPLQITNQPISLLTTGEVGIGTTSPRWALTISSSTAPQIQIGSGTGVAGWSFRSSGGNLYISSTSPTTFATDTPMSALTISPGKFGANLSLNTPGIPRATLDLYEQNGTGCSPSILMGGNSGGDTDYWICRNSDNSGTDNDKFQIGRDTVPGTNPLLTIDNIGQVGIGSSTPWGLLNVASSTWGQAVSDYMKPLFAVATSSDNYGRLINIFATSSTMISNQNPFSYVLDSGVRVAIGASNYLGLNGFLDQLYVNGRINTGDWHNVNCDAIGTNGNGSSGNVCGPFGSRIGTTGDFIGTTTPGSGIIMTKICTSGNTPCSNNPTAANNGVGLFYPTPASTAAYNSLTLGTSTPILEGAIRNGWPLNASSTYIYFGFTDTNVTSMTAVEPTNGCFFMASSTVANWMAVAKSAGTATIITTNIASSSQSTVAGTFYRLRVEASKGNCTFYIASKTQTFIKVASLSTTTPDTVGLVAGTYAANISAGLGKIIDVAYMRLWYQSPVLNYDSQ